ncbi:PAS domain S-box protein [Terasakiella sp. SH-1]|uniref:PAS domain S-box protein n=1 Tax=Terasakiella sp. SH-1 TaxID=2560057 RepID=UPI00107398E3|nr:PAS domain S-box protein [Terasakiella sp. SH-1]
MDKFGWLSRAAFDAIVGGVIILDTRFKVVLWNDWMSIVTHTHAHDAEGQRLIDIFPELEKSRIIQSTERAIDQGMASFLSHSLNKRLFPLKRKDQMEGKQTEICQNVTIKPFFDEEGEKYCLIQIEDVSKTVMRENLLKSASERFQAIFNTVKDGIVITDRSGIIESLNPAALEIFDCQQDDLINRKITDLLTETDMYGFSKGEKTPQEHRYEQVLTTKTGKTTVIEYDVNVMTLEGQAHYVSIIQDVTLRKQNEKELRSRTRELEQFNDAMVDREIRMIELKEEINKLTKELGRPIPYEEIWNDQAD